MLRYLLETYPNTVITSGAVCEALGRPVARQTVGKAAQKLTRGSFGSHIHSQAGLGYVLLVPVPATNGEACEVCAHRSVIGTCRRLKGRPVDDATWCWGFTKEAAA